MFPARSPRVRHQSELTEGKHRIGTRKTSTDLLPCVSSPCRRSYLITVTSYTCSLTSEVVSQRLDMVCFLEATALCSMFKESHSPFDSNPPEGFTTHLPPTRQTAPPTQTKQIPATSQTRGKLGRVNFRKDFWGPARPQ